MNNSYSLGEQVVWSTPASRAVQSPTRAVRLEIIGKIKVFPDKNLEIFDGLKLVITITRNPKNLEIFNIGALFADKN